MDRKLTECGECGMMCEPAEFHPYAACLMFHGCHNGKIVRDNLAALAPQAAEQRQEGCSHDETRPSYDHVRCVACGSVYVDSGWGIARGQWFPSLDVARFYKENGRLPDAPEKWLPMPDFLRRDVDPATAAPASGDGVRTMRAISEVIADIDDALAELARSGGPLKETDVRDWGNELRAALNTPPAGAAPEQGEADGRNFRGETFAEARRQLVNVLKAQKSWLTGYAEAYVDDFLDLARPPSEASGVWVDDAMVERACEAYQRVRWTGRREVMAQNDATRHRAAIAEAIAAALTQQPQGGDAMGVGDGR